jgi:heme-degrading monooxygenase HmoA
VARYEVAADRCDESVKAFLDSAKSISGMDGFDSGFVLVDSDTGETMTVTFWESRAAADASATHAASARRRAIDAVDGEVQSVQSFDVVRPFAS